MSNARVKITSLEKFERKGLIRNKSSVVEYPLIARNIHRKEPLILKKKFSGIETALRAMSFIGEFKGDFDISLFNCEHFCTMCVTDVVFSS